MTTLTLRDPWRYPFADFDGLFRTFGTEVARPGFRPAAEITREGEDAVVRRDERADERDGRVLREVRYGAFRRTFKLPAHVAGSDLSAAYEAGVLVVRVAGAYRGSTAQRIPVTVGAPALDTAEADAPAEGTDA